MNIPEIYINVIKGLLQKSVSKEVIWDITTDANIFVVYFKDSSLTLRQHSNQNETWYSVNIIDYKGDEIDSFWIDSETIDDYSIISELFSIARRSALAIDNTVQNMLSEINSKGIIGNKKKNNDGFTDDIPF